MIKELVGEKDRTLSNLEVLKDAAKEIVSKDGGCEF